MRWLLLFGGLLAAMMLPVRLWADLHHGQRRLLRLRLVVAGLQREWLMELIATPEGHRILVGRKGAAPSCVGAEDMRSGPADRLIAAIRQTRPVRRFLVRHTHAEQLDAQLLLHTRSAAATALLTGAVQSAIGCLPLHWRQTARIRVLPDFLREHTTLQARCIFRLRLGTILITACLLLADKAAQAINREVRSIWNTPSEN